MKNEKDFKSSGTVRGSLLWKDWFEFVPSGFFTLHSVLRSEVNLDTKRADCRSCGTVGKHGARPEQNIS